MSVKMNLFQALGSDDEETVVKKVVPEKKEEKVSSKQEAKEVRKPFEPRKDRRPNKSTFTGEGLLDKEQKDAKPSKHQQSYHKRHHVGDEKHKRPFERHSGTGQGKEMKKDGAGKANWGSVKGETKKKLEDIQEKPEKAQEEVVQQTEEKPVVVEVDNTITLEEYYKSKNKELINKTEEKPVERKIKDGKVEGLEVIKARAEVDEDINKKKKGKKAETKETSKNLASEFFYQQENKAKQVNKYEKPANKGKNPKAEGIKLDDKDFPTLQQPCKQSINFRLLYICFYAHKKSDSEFSNTFLFEKKQNEPRQQRINIAVRVRPPLKREYQKENFAHCVSVKENKIQILESEEFIISTQHTFSFDQVFDSNMSQKQVYQYCGQELVKKFLDGYNGSIIAYGPTGTGKTYTMEGPNLQENDDNNGIISRSFEQIFNDLQYSKADSYTVLVSYLQIYNENISDLLNKEPIQLIIRDDKKTGVKIDGLSEHPVNDVHDVWELLKIGANNRTKAATNINELSSRSHAIFIIKLEQHTNQARYISKLKLVDLAGSERASVSGVTGKRLDECKKINQSLMTLGNVIKSLACSYKHIPYRNSKLTRLLEDSLGGNSLTTLIAMISPANFSYQESVFILKSFQL